MAAKKGCGGQGFFKGRLPLKLFKATGDRSTACGERSEGRDDDVSEKRNTLMTDNEGKN